MPVDTRMEKVMTSPVAANPVNPRVSTQRTSAMIARLVGRKIIWLVTDASVKVWVDHDRTDHPEIDTRILLLRLGGESAGEIGDLGHRDDLVDRRQFHGDADDD